MKSYTLAPLLFLLQLQTPGGSIEGIVVAIGTTDPIAGASVTLVRTQAPSTALPAAPPLPAALSGNALPPPSLPAISAVIADSQGKFVFKDIDAGSYRIQVACNAYARTEYGHRVFGGHHERRERIKAPLRKKEQ